MAVLFVSSVQPLEMFWGAFMAACCTPLCGACARPPSQMNGRPSSSPRKGCSRSLKCARCCPSQPCTLKGIIVFGFGITWWSSQHLPLRKGRDPAGDAATSPCCQPGRAEKLHQKNERSSGYPRLCVQSTTDFLKST